MTAVPRASIAAAAPASRRRRWFRVRIALPRIFWSFVAVAAIPALAIALCEAGVPPRATYLLAMPLWLIAAWWIAISLDVGPPPSDSA